MLKLWQLVSRKLWQLVSRKLWQLENNFLTYPSMAASISWSCGSLRMTYPPSNGSLCLRSGGSLRITYPLMAASVSWSCGSLRMGSLWSINNQSELFFCTQRIPPWYFLCRLSILITVQYVLACKREFICYFIVCTPTAGRRSDIYCTGMHLAVLFRFTQYA
jgi:hypothetical protein